MNQFCSCFVKGMSDSSEQELQSAQTLPALSPQCSKSEPRCFCGEPSQWYKDDWIVDWEPYQLPYVFKSWDCLRYRPGLNCIMKRGTEVSQSERHGEPQVSPGDVDNDKDTEEADQPSPSLLRKKELELETCEGEDFPDHDPASDSPRCLGCFPWFHRTFGQKK